MVGMRLGLSGRALWMVLTFAAPGLAACAPAAVEQAPAAKAPPPRMSPAVEAEMRKVPVAMYMTTWCPYCMKARHWLKNGGYNFIEHDVEQDERAAAVLLTFNPRGSVPMFDVDGLILVGFEPAELHAAIRARAAGKPQGGGWGQASPQP